MTSFALELCSATERRRIEAVASFVGRDASGQFGIMAGHVPFATVLEDGLARYRSAAAPGWRYLALAGGTLRFCGGVLAIATRIALEGDDYRALGEALAERLARLSRQQADLRHNLDRFEQAVFERLRELERR